jgi:hypothetical protein
MKKYTKEDLTKLSKEELISLILNNSNDNKYSINIIGYNNANMGLKKHGGEMFIKAKIVVDFSMTDAISWELKNYTPSGLIKGGLQEFKGFCHLSNSEIRLVNKIGPIQFAIRKLEIPKYLEMEFDKDLFFVKNSTKTI